MLLPLLTALFIPLFDYRMAGKSAAARFFSYRFSSRFPNRLSALNPPRPNMFGVFGVPSFHHEAGQAAVGVMARTANPGTGQVGSGTAATFLKSMNGVANYFRA